MKGAGLGEGVKGEGLGYCGTQANCFQQVKSQYLFEISLYVSFSATAKPCSLSDLPRDISSVRHKVLYLLHICRLWDSGHLGMFCSK